MNGRHWRRADEARQRREVKEQAKLQLQFTTILDIGKFLYDSYFKLATMSFTLNGLLLTAISYVSAQAVPNKLSKIGIIPMVGCVGVIYNSGALTAFLSEAFLARKLLTKFSNLDQRLGMEISECRQGLSGGFGSIALALTVLFFGFWIYVWAKIAILS